MLPATCQLHKTSTKTPMGETEASAISHANENESAL